MTYLNGPLHLAAVFDSIRYGNGAGNDARDFGNSAAFSLAAVYDFGVLKLYTSGMWFDGMWGKKFQGHDFGKQSSISADATYTGYAVQTGADIPAWGGTVKLNLGWMDAKADEVSDGAKVSDTDRLAFSAGYVYPLSKRTNVYWAGGCVPE